MGVENPEYDSLTYTFEAEIMDRAINILRDGLNPKVTFTGDVEQMREEARTQTKTAIEQALQIFEQELFIKPRSGER
jgi:hypothetical protein